MLCIVNPVFIIFWIIMLIINKFARVRGALWSKVYCPRLIIISGRGYYDFWVIPAKIWIVGLGHDSIGRALVMGGKPYGLS
jgi:hypothetical protein